MKARTTLPLIGLLCLFIINFTYAENNNEDFAGIHCPGDKFVTCDDELWDLSSYGNAEYVDYSGTHDAGIPTVKYYLNSCGQGHIKRTWKVKIYNQWHSCSQYIYVEGSKKDVHIYWPDDIELDGCNPVTDPNKLVNGRPTWNSTECSMLASSHRDTYFNFGSSSCNTIIREWTVMDWCTYDEYRNPHKGIYKHSQTIKIVNDDIPLLECPEDVTISSYNCSGAYVTVNELAVDAASCGGEYSVKNDSPYAIGSGKNISGNYPIGTTQVTYSVTYGCGQRINCKVNVTVANNKAPTPYCRGDLSVALMGMDTDGDNRNDEGMVELWAKDLDLGSEGVCGNQELFFSFSEDINDTLKIFTCDDVGKNDVAMYVTDKLGNQDYCIVKVSVQNNAANIINCSAGQEVTEVESETENEAEGEGVTTNIDSSLFIAGNILDQFGNAVDGMEFEIQDLDGKMEITVHIDTVIDIRLDSVWTEAGFWDYRLSIDTIVSSETDTVYNADYKMITSDNLGSYKVENYFEKNKDYMVSVYENKNMDVKHPQVLDLRVLYDHVTGRVPFTNHHQFLAADLNGDGRVDFSDVNEIINVLVSNKSDYSSGKSYRIMRNNAEMPVSESILNMDDLSYYMVENIESSFSNADFMLVYLGLFSEGSGQLTRNQIKTRSNELIAITKTSNNNELINALDHFFGYEKNIVGNVAVYPNPARDNITIEITCELNEQGKFEIFDLSGRLVHSESRMLSEGPNKINFSVDDIPDGIYISKISTHNQSFKNRMIISR